MSVYRYIEELENKYFFVPHSKLFTCLQKHRPSEFGSIAKAYPPSLIFQNVLLLILDKELYSISNEDFIVPDRELREIFNLRTFPLSLLESLIFEHLYAAGKENIPRLANTGLRHHTLATLRAIWHQGNIAYLRALEKGRSFKESDATFPIKLSPILLQILGLRNEKIPCLVLEPIIISFIIKETHILERDCPIGVLFLENHVLRFVLGFNIVYTKDILLLLRAFFLFKIR